VRKSRERPRCAEGQQGFGQREGVHRSRSPTLMVSARADCTAGSPSPRRRFPRSGAVRLHGRLCAKASHETGCVRVTRRSKRRDLRDRSGNTHGKACIGVGRWALDPRGRPTLVVTGPDRASMGHAEQGLRTRQSGAIPAPPMDGGTNGGEVEGPLCRDSQDNTPEDIHQDFSQVSV